MYTPQNTAECLVTLCENKNNVFLNTDLKNFWELDQSRGEYLLMLRNDLHLLSPEWVHSKFIWGLQNIDSLTLGRGCDTVV